jgi:hypothetical protein
MTTVATALAPATPTPEEQAILDAYQKTERHGLEFGRPCYEYRAKSEVVSGGTTFNQTLDKLEIPHSSAYRWIARYEISIGLREPAEISPTQPRANVAPPHGVTEESWQQMGRAERLESKRAPTQQTIEAHLRNSDEKADHENRLGELFKGCGFHFYIKQNSATNVAHFNVVFSALLESQVRELADKLRG